MMCSQMACLRNARTAHTSPKTNNGNSTPVLARAGNASAMSATVTRVIPGRPLLDNPTQRAALRHKNQYILPTMLRAGSRLGNGIFANATHHPTARVFHRESGHHPATPFQSLYADTFLHRRPCCLLQPTHSASRYAPASERAHFDAMGAPLQCQQPVPGHGPSPRPTLSNEAEGIRRAHTPPPSLLRCHLHPVHSAALGIDRGTCGYLDRAQVPT